ncbi:MAG: divalent-cation tolerance protein CutA [Cyanobacteriota bacterium]|nr:divalent-cation tolerance protein CutA [Cyanobacteriota bacterium]
MDDPSACLTLVLTTEASSQQAETLARQLLEQRLVACVSLWPVRSLYRWQGQLEQSQEVQMLLKLPSRDVPALMERLPQLHSYDTPEWITLPAATAGPYAAWIFSPDGAPPVP